MQVGMIGLGRMGANLVRRLMRDGHQCAVYDVRAESVAELALEGAVGASSLEELVAALTPPRILWIMIPAGYVEATLEKLVPHLEASDVVIDGGNSFFEDDVHRSQRLRERGVLFLDVGTSGGVHGLERGYCLMIGGDRSSYDRLDPVWRTLAPGFAAASRTPGRTGDPHTAELGFLYCGPAGAGHFVKMIHNGIEYGLMAAYAEGLAVLERADLGVRSHLSEADRSLLRHPERYGYDFDVAGIAEVWRRGSVITSWLLDLTAAALQGDPELAGYSGHVSDSGEGRWTVHTGVDLGVPTYVIASALYQRFASRDEGDFADRTISAMRHQFGGHVELPAGG